MCGSVQPWCCDKEEEKTSQRKGRGVRYGTMTTVSTTTFCSSQCHSPQKQNIRNKIIKNLITNEIKTHAWRPYFFCQ